MQCGRPGFNPRVGKIPWSRAWQPTPVFLLGDSPWTEEPGVTKNHGHYRATNHSTAHGRGPGLIPYGLGPHVKIMLQLRDEKHSSHLSTVSPDWSIVSVLICLSSLCPSFKAWLRGCSYLKKLMHYYFKWFNLFYILSSQRCLSIKSLMLLFSILLI